MQSQNPPSGEACLVSMKRVCELTSLSRTMLNRYRAEGRFPAAVPLGDRRVAFVKSEIAEWINARVAARGVNDNKPLAGRGVAI
jgi:prophage regulatory protein